MSQEDLTQFLEAVRQDPSLQEKLKAEGADPVAIAKEAGFSITKAELVRTQAAHVQTLSDKELEALAGGGCLFTKLRYDEGPVVPYSNDPEGRNYQCRPSQGSGPSVYY